MRSVVLIAALIVSCGSDPATEQPTQASPVAPVATEQPGQSSVDPQATKAPEASATSVIQSLTADTAADLPACDASRERQLIYVTEANQFHTCRKGQWTAIDLKGKDGVDGKDGVAGVAGKDGVNGVDGKLVNGNMWYDPIAMRYWTFTTVVTTLLQAKAACTGSWHIPTPTEISVAFARGLTASATVAYWSTLEFPVDRNGDVVQAAAYALCVETK